MEHDNRQVWIIEPGRLQRRVSIGSVVAGEDVGDAVAGEEASDLVRSRIALRTDDGDLSWAGLEASRPLVQKLRDRPIEELVGERQGTRT